MSNEQGEALKSSAAGSTVWKNR